MNVDKRKTQVEVLAPAGSLDIMKAVVAAGADAIYLGGNMFGARAFANNFNDEELICAIEYAHLFGRKVYLTVNTLLKSREIENSLIEYLIPFYEAGLDAVIVQDMGVFNLIRKHFPDMDIHASTQMAVTGCASAGLLKRMGATRVVPARELTLDDIKKIDQNVDIEIESFVHGALCYSYSGQCLMSSMLGDRSGNRGRCAQPCRMKYDNEYVLSLKDMCTLELIPQLVQAGVDSFKIEGRMKTALYVATVARTYRLAIDDFLKDPELYKSRIPFYKSEISKCTYRQYTTGFFFGKPDENTQIYESNTYIKEYTYLGIVGDKNEEGLYNIEQRNKFSVGEEIEVMKPDGTNLLVTVKRITDEKGVDMESCPHPKQQLYIDLGVELERYDILRRKEE